MHGPHWSGHVTQPRIALLASHEGSLMQAVIDACEASRLQARIGLIISNNSDSGALRRAAQHGIPGMHLSRKTHGDDAGVDATMAEALDQAAIDLVVLVGYMRLIGPRVLHRFHGRIINCHPALLPKYGGKGFYGQHVHQAVIAAGDTESGSTIHFVDEVYDQGPIIRQSRVPVHPDDTAESLEARVKAAEHQLLIDAVGEILQT